MRHRYMSRYRVDIITVCVCVDFVNRRQQQGNGSCGLQDIAGGDPGYSIADSPLFITKIHQENGGRASGNCFFACDGCGYGGDIITVDRGQVTVAEGKDDGGAV